MAERLWALDTLNTNIHRITITLDRVGETQPVLLHGDAHWDNPDCDREKLTRHLTEAKDKDAPVIDVGDWFCAMQGRFDKRSNKFKLRPEHQVAHYLDALVDTSAEYLRPFADVLTVRGVGNHETGIMKRHETHLTERLVERLKALEPTSPIQRGGYHGFVVFQVSYQNTKRKPFKLYYHHGGGGGGAVTKGVIASNRQAAYLADADIVVNGHTHDAWYLPLARVRLNQDCTDIEHTEQLHLRTSTYKQEWNLSSEEFHVEKWGPPKPVGRAWWLTFTYADYKRIDLSVTEAK